VKTIFLQALEAEDKAASLLRTIGEKTHGDEGTWFERDSLVFADVPASPFAYWVSDRLRQTFRKFRPFEGGARTARVGAQTSDDFRFVRSWWETPVTPSRSRWVPFVKGGGRSSFYNDIALSLKWEHDGAELKAFAERTPGTKHWTRMIRSPDFYLRPGFSWALRTARFAPSSVPAGCIFSASRAQAFTDRADLLPIIGLFNSSTATALLRISSEWFSRPKFVSGLVKALPVPDLDNADRAALSALARDAWSLKRELSTCIETSHAFTLPALLQVQGSTLAARAAAWADRVGAIEMELAGIQAKIDELSFEVYGIDDDDRRAISEGFGARVVGAPEPEADGNYEDEAAAEEEPAAAVDVAELCADLVSWAVGVAFGRFDVRRCWPGRPECLPA
jgi:hypothetical protein